MFMIHPQGLEQSPAECALRVNDIFWKYPKVHFLLNGRPGFSNLKALKADEKPCAEMAALQYTILLRF